MIKNIVFDMGNVILKLRMELSLKRYIEDVNDYDIVKKYIFDSEEWGKLDEGTITKEDAIKTMQSNLPEHLREKCFQIMQTWKEDILVVNEDIIDLIKKLRQNGYNTYVLSNAPVDIPGYVKDLGIENLFNGTVYSCDYKTLKPKDDIYQILFNKYDLKPEECYFIDDKKENVEGSIRNNMYAFQFNYEKFEDLLKDLEKNNIAY